jgi:hypothetical protein
MEVRASIEVTFAALLDQLGPYNETQVDRPMPMKLEAWPGGRWYRDLGDNNGHYWGTVQAIKKPTLLEICGPLFMSNPVITNLQYRLKESGGVTILTFRQQSFGLVLEEYRNAKNGWAHLHSVCDSERKRRGPTEARMTQKSEEGNMCPSCIASAAVMAAGAGSTGGILAVCIGQFRKFFRANGLFQKIKEK